MLTFDEVSTYWHSLTFITLPLASRIHTGGWGIQVCCCDAHLLRPSLIFTHNRSFSYPFSDQTLKMSLLLKPEWKTSITNWRLEGKTYPFSIPNFRPRWSKAKVVSLPLKLIYEVTPGIHTWYLSNRVRFFRWKICFHF